jgi:hypothetical protein
LLISDTVRAGWVRGVVLTEALLAEPLLPLPWLVELVAA